MVIGLDSARKQLQWRLIYATLDIDSGGFAGCGSVFCQWSIISSRTETATSESDAATDAQSVRPHSETANTEGKSILAQTGDTRQYTYRRFDSQTAGLPHDRGPSRGRWPNLLWAAWTRNTQGTFQCDGKGPQSSLQPLWRLR